MSNSQASLFFPLHLRTDLNAIVAFFLFSFAQLRAPCIDVFFFFHSAFPAFLRYSSVESSFHAGLSDFFLSFFIVKYFFCTLFFLLKCSLF